MDPIITDALTTAGTITKATTNSIRASNYVVYPDGIAPDLRYTMALLADALIDDATGFDALGDDFIIKDHAYEGTGVRRQAVARRDRRTALTDALTNLSRDERIRLIDALADGLSTVAA